MSLAEPQERAVKRTVALAGATGLVGRSILAGLLADKSVQSVHVLGRRNPRVAHARITGHIVDFAALPPLPPVDEVYLALGTTIKVAGSQAAFRAVDFDANLAVGRAALAAGARRCGLVSAMGANAKSGLFYNRVKGELEEALAQLPFEGLVIARPSLLMGDRVALGQPERPLEKVSAVPMKVFGPLIPANYRAIGAAQVARTLLARTPWAEGRAVVLGRDEPGARRVVFSRPGTKFCFCPLLQYCPLGSSSVSRRRLSGRLETPDKQQQRDCGQCQPRNDTEAIHEGQQAHLMLQLLV